MATVIIDEKTSKEKKLLEFLKSFSDEKFIFIEKEPNETERRRQSHNPETFSKVPNFGKVKKLNHPLHSVNLK